jgi:hypothetical protein
MNGSLREAKPTDVAPMFIFELNLYLLDILSVRTGFHPGEHLHDSSVARANGQPIWLDHYKSARDHNSIQPAAVSRLRRQPRPNS